MNKILSITVLVILLTANSFCQSWNLKIIDVDTSKFPVLNTYFSLYDVKGEFLNNLSNTDVTLYEGKKLISTFKLDEVTTNAKVSVAVMLDVSGSMKGNKIKDAVNAVTSLLSMLKETDEASIVTFGSTVDNPIGFTNNYELLKSNMNNISLSNKTRLFDAVLETAKLFSKYDNKRNLVILITDGKDDGSLSTITEAIDELKRKKIEAFCIGIGKDADVFTLRRLAEITGSYYFQNINVAKDGAISGLSESLMNIYTLQNKAYRLSYTTPDSVVDVSYSQREISLRVNYNGITKVSDQKFVVPKNIYPVSILWYTAAGFLFIVLIGLILFLFTKRKRGEQNIFVAEHEPQRYHTPGFDDDENGEDDDDDYEQKIRDQKTVILNRGSFKTDSSLGYLVLRSKKFGMHVYEVQQRELIIGRGQDSDIFLDDESVSRIHTKVRIVDKVFFIDDLGSSNGTLLNGQVIYHAELKDGDIITVGLHELIFKCID